MLVGVVHNFLHGLLLLMLSALMKQKVDHLRLYVVKYWKL